MRVVIIGAGSAGLVSAKQVLANHFECDVLEATSELGGVWVYNEKVGEDEYGYPIYSAMYRNLRTNLPKEIMDFPEIQIPSKTDSYLSQTDILNYLRTYADTFNLKKVIKFNRVVTSVAPTENNKWIIKSIDKITKTEFSQETDVVMICNGHYSAPFVPTLKDIEKFKGNQIHSHQYRYPDNYKDKKVLIIGAGPSAMDLTSQICKLAFKVVVSHHNKSAFKSKIAPNVYIKKFDVDYIYNENEIVFKDGSKDTFDSIVYCTGYKYSFPFLDKSSGISVTNNYVEPVYKQIIHIEKPTLCFIGLPFIDFPFRMFDIQVRFYMTYLNGKMILPSKEDMKQDAKHELQLRLEKGYPKHKGHILGPFQSDYYKQLSELANITPIPNVLLKIYANNMQRLLTDPMNFRNDRYKIIDNENFVMI